MLTKLLPLDTSLIIFEQQGLQRRTLVMRCSLNIRDTSCLRENW